METRAVHAGRGVDPATGAVTLPIHLSTTFERDADGGYPRGYEYARASNPNRTALEECVRELEGGAAAAAFSSGMAATMTVLQTLSPGDHAIVADDTYFGTREIFRDLFSGWGVETSFVDMTDAYDPTWRGVARRTAHGAGADAAGARVRHFDEHAPRRVVLLRLLVAASWGNSRRLVVYLWAVPARCCLPDGGVPVEQAVPPQGRQRPTHHNSNNCISFTSPAGPILEDLGSIAARRSSSSTPCRERRCRERCASTHRGWPAGAPACASSARLGRSAPPSPR